MRVLHERTLPLTIVGLLLIVGAAGGAFTRALIRGDDGRQNTLARLYRIEVAAAEVGAAQGAYLAPGQPDEPWFQLSGELLQRLQSDVSSIQDAIQSPDGAIHLQEATAALTSFAQIDGHIREYLTTGEEFSATDLILTDARTALASFVSSIRRLEERERAVAALGRKHLATLGWVLVGAASLLGIVGLMLIVRSSRAAAAPPPDVQASGPGLAVDHLNIQKPPIGLPSTPEAVSFQAAADVCIAISRISRHDALPDLLGRAAIVLDATGIIVWMEAGEELFAAAAHGYDPRALAQFGPIGRHDNNATAAAWRSGELSTVPGNQMSNGALAAPILGKNRCIGVLAAELRHGRESDPTARAVVTIIAAQLASVLSARPAASAEPLVREDAAS